MSIRLLIADDHAVLRRGLVALIAAAGDMVVEAEAADATAALREARRIRPDVVILDLTMPGAVGTSLITDMIREVPESAILVLTMHEDGAVVRSVLDAGAKGYLVKRAVATEIVDAVRAVARGEIYVHPSLTRELLGGGPTRSVSGTGGLTPREIEVVRLLAHGLTNREVADRLHISVRTVEGHRASIMRRLDAHTRADLVYYCERKGLF